MLLFVNKSIAFINLVYINFFLHVYYNMLLLFVNPYIFSYFDLIFFGIQHLHFTCQFQHLFAFNFRSRDFPVLVKVYQNQHHSELAKVSSDET